MYHSGVLKHVEHAHHADQQVINILIAANYHKNIHHADQWTSTSEKMTFNQKWSMYLDGGGCDVQKQSIPMMSKTMVLKT